MQKYFSSLHLKCAIALTLLLFAIQLIYRKRNEKLKVNIHASHPYYLGHPTQTESLQNLSFDVNKDVLVFIHAQKTGGTFLEKQLLRVINTSTCHCKKSLCDCSSMNRTFWQFGRYTTGWACGLHADWTELHDCVPKMLDRKEGVNRNRQYHYIYLFRHPQQRFISEWLHVRRGATWLSSTLRCRGRSPSLDEWPTCYQGLNWRRVEMAEFASCEYNLARNRQTRMLSDLSLVQCYNLTAMPRSSRDKILLASALNNLSHLSYVGVLEWLVFSQYVFHRTFHLTFQEVWLPQEFSLSERVLLSEAEMALVMQSTQLDKALYFRAVKLLLERTRGHLLVDDRVPISVRESLAAGIDVLKSQRGAFETLVVRLLRQDGSRMPSLDVVRKRIEKIKAKLRRQISQA